MASVENPLGSIQILSLVPRGRHTVPSHIHHQQKTTENPRGSLKEFVHHVILIRLPPLLSGDPRAAYSAISDSSSEGCPTAAYSGSDRAAVVAYSGSDRCSAISDSGSDKAAAAAYSGSDRAAVAAYSGSDRSSVISNSCSEGCSAGAESGSDRAAAAAKSGARSAEEGQKRKTR
ncbi:hypothetical protein FCM35_KLT03595 [Carex littledalei]|uniref:Uncharacterized protein n=1 Tax=Carex littledalei TaxID=544730 RepID=A0A833QZ26_9POAL|nr:hypothetical protein FCM35_KLT03595 [Carex littledalei]